MNTGPCPTLQRASRSATVPTNILAALQPGPGQRWPAEISAWLDKSDRIVHLSSHWDHLAPAAYRRSEVLARPMGWFIADETVRECYRALFNRVRREHRPARIVSRWDEANEPRLLRVNFVPLSAGALEISWTLLDGAVARQLAPSPRRVFQDSELVRMCGWCHDVHMGSQWQRLEVAATALGLLDHHSLPSITHGICPACCRALTAENSSHSTLQVAV